MFPFAGAGPASVPVTGRAVIFRYKPRLEHDCENSKHRHPRQWWKLSGFVACAPIPGSLHSSRQQMAEVDMYKVYA